MPIKAGVTSLYSHDIILVLFQRILKQNCKETSLQTGASLDLPGHFQEYARPLYIIKSGKHKMGESRYC